MTDGELVRQAMAGRVAAYGELAERWAAPVMAVCHARVRGAHAAEDLAQETLLRGFRGLETLADPDKFGPWLKGIAHRVCFDWLKAKQTSQVPFTVLKTNGHPDGLVVSDADRTTRSVEQADETDHLLTAVEGLPDELREILMLYYYQDATYQQLADQLDVSAATVNARLTKARALLRKRLTASGRTP